MDANDGMDCIAREEEKTTLFVLTTFTTYSVVMVSVISWELFLLESSNSLKLIMELEMKQRTETPFKSDVS